MNVMSNQPHGLAFLDQQRLVATLEEVALFTAEPIEAVGEGRL